MAILLLHPTSTALWYTLVHEAQKSCSTYLKEDLESYLVFLLMRFTRKPEIASSVLGLDFLQSYQKLTQEQQHQLLKDIGDQCLLYAGLFPGRAAKRRVKLSYYVKLGQMAYSTLSSYLTFQEKLFLQLCAEFPKLMDVLQATRETSTQTIDLLQTLELWHETKSPAALRRLQDVTRALSIPICENKSVH